MLCSRVLNQLNAYIDYELTGADMLEIREHLSGCPSCAREYASARQVKQLLRGLPTVEADRPFTPAVLKAQPRLRFDLPEWCFRAAEYARRGAVGLQRSACYMATGVAVAFSVMAISALQTPKPPDGARAHVPESLAADSVPTRQVGVLPTTLEQPLIPVLTRDGETAFYLNPNQTTFYAEPDAEFGATSRVRPVGYSRPYSVRRYQPVFLGDEPGSWPIRPMSLYLELNER